MLDGDRRMLDGDRRMLDGDRRMLDGDRRPLSIDRRPLSVAVEHPSVAPRRASLPAGAWGERVWLAIERFGGTRWAIGSHGQPGQPRGQVPFTGSAHWGFVTGTLESTMQQSWPEAQQKVPQQNAPRALHSRGGLIMHAGMGAQVPLSQNGVVPEQTVPQAPQLCGSL
jgi:hypothetical protein